MHDEGRDDENNVDETMPLRYRASDSLHPLKSAEPLTYGSAERFSTRICLAAPVVRRRIDEQKC